MQGGENPTENPPKTKKTKLAITIVIILILAYAYRRNSRLLHRSSSHLHQINLNTQITNSHNQIQAQLPRAQTDSSASTDNTSLSQIYQQVEPSVVVVQDFTTLQTDIFAQAYYTQVEGSGFTYNLNGQDVIVTNYHVVDGGCERYSHVSRWQHLYCESAWFRRLLRLSCTFNRCTTKRTVPLTVTSSSSLQVGDQVIAIGSPYGLTGSMTTGIISALNRTITEDTANGYAISDIVQTSTAINPGNSGGPLLNYKGQVIGITTAVVDNSQGLGFAIPSDTILREAQDLAQNGAYNQHPYLGIGGADMTYDIATQMKVTVTYGVLIQQVTSGGPQTKLVLKLAQHKPQLMEAQLPLEATL